MIGCLLDPNQYTAVLLDPTCESSTKKRLL